MSSFSYRISKPAKPTKKRGIATATVCTEAGPRENQRLAPLISFPHKLVRKMHGIRRGYQFNLNKTGSILV